MAVCISNEPEHLNRVRCKLRWISTFSIDEYWLMYWWYCLTKTVSFHRNTQRKKENRTANSSSTKSRNESFKIAKHNFQLHRECSKSFQGFPVLHKLVQPPSTELREGGESRTMKTRQMQLNVACMWNTGIYILQPLLRLKLYWRINGIVW